MMNIIQTIIAQESIVEKEVHDARQTVRAKLDRMLKTGAYGRGRKIYDGDDWVDDETYTTTGREVAYAPAVPDDATPEEMARYVQPFDPTASLGAPAG
jgi:hypothetical protein